MVHRSLLILPLLLCTLSLAGGQDGGDPKQLDPKQLDPKQLDPKRQGQALLAAHCARCHAIASTGESPHRQAPPFRTLGQKYPVDWLAEALGEGLSTGHPDMPEFVFEPQEINAILTYLQSIQVPKTGPLQRR
jgi:mono/diheme cytochrome c family protein